jgi:hypothetical protein
LACFFLVDPHFRPCYFNSCIFLFAGNGRKKGRIPCDPDPGFPWAGTLVFSNHFISFFIGLELLSISIYILISYTRERQNSIEAAIKYLLLSGVASAVLLMGMALIYAVTGGIGFSG